MQRCHSIQAFRQGNPVVAVVSFLPSRPPSGSVRLRVAGLVELAGHDHRQFRELDCQELYVVPQLQLLVLRQNVEMIDHLAHRSSELWVFLAKCGGEDFDRRPEGLLVGHCAPSRGLKTDGRGQEKIAGDPKSCLNYYRMIGGGQPNKDPLVCGGG
jgi:hypothetical protein